VRVNQIKQTKQETVQQGNLQGVDNMVLVKAADYKLRNCQHETN
jgi:hypothetical protein